jgi:hypothetical protein
LTFLLKRNGISNENVWVISNKSKLGGMKVITTQVLRTTEKKMKSKLEILDKY